MNSFEQILAKNLEAEQARCAELEALLVDCVIVVGRLAAFHGRFGNNAKAVVLGVNGVRPIEVRDIDFAVQVFDRMTKTLNGSGALGAEQ